jgi:hypothetical protein
MENNDVTTAHTLWTETILDLLYDFLRSNRPDEEIRTILLEVRKKGIKPDYVVRKAGEKLDQQAAMRLKDLIQNSGRE